MHTHAFNSLLLSLDASAASHFPTAALLTIIFGFIAAVSLGSVAWYNSKRPVGWEGKERPDFVPKVDK